MDRKQALEVLREYQEWRRYDGPMVESPPQPDAFIVGQAIDTAIQALSEQVEPKKQEKEYYGG
jgi:hypothetical protein